MGELPLCKRAVIGSNPIASIVTGLAALGVVSGYACSRPAPEPESAARSLPAPHPLAEERRVLRAAEAALLEQRATEALEESRPQQAAQAVSMGLEVAPERFAPLLERTLALVGSAVGAELVGRADPERAARLRAQATRQAVIAEHAEGLPDRLQGVTLAHGQAVLDGVRREYVEVPDEAALACGARERLGWIREAAGAPGTPVCPLACEGVRPEAVIRAAIACGVPEPAAVAGGVEGALAALDPYTRPVWPAEIAAWTQHHAGVVVGVGLSLLDGPEGTVVVERPELGGPAWSADVRQGDLVVQVGDKRVADLPRPRASAVSAALGGSEGTAVRVLLQRGGAPPHEVVLERKATPEATVHGWRRGAGNVWQLSPPDQAGVVVVRISAFRPSTDEAFDALLQSMTPRAVVLDLRGNAGGDVMAAANIADRFIASGVVADLVGRTIAPQSLAEGEVAWNTALPGHALEGVPVAVLVDRDSASAAELLAGALQERAGALLVGERTVGKGRSQALRADDDVGVAWQVTTGRWVLPSGRSVEELSPDVVVRLSPAERFATRVRRDQREHLVAHADGTPLRYVGAVQRPDLPPLSADPQLQAALAALR